MWTWFEGWSRSYPARTWSRTVSGGSPSFAELHRPAEYIGAGFERDERWDNLNVHDFRAEWHWTPERGWHVERSEYRPGLALPLP